MAVKAIHTQWLERIGLDLSSLVAKALVLLPAALSYLVLYLVRLPFPYQDDFDALLAFAVRYNDAAGWSQKALDVAVVRHNEYRLIFEHLVVAAEVGVTHRLNFAFLTALGDLFLLGIAILLWLSFRAGPLKTKLLSFVPVSLLFFGLVYWETLNWAMAALQGLPAIFFALTALYLLIPQDGRVVTNSRLLLSCVAAGLSCCSSANGFLLAPLGVVILVSRRTYGYLACWLLSFVLPFWAYRYHAAETPMDYSFHWKQIFYFVAFFGGALPTRPAAFIAGALVLVILVWAVRSRLVGQSPVLFFLAIWIVLTSVLVEAVRSALTSRYSIYSVLLVICCYQFFLNAFERRPGESTRLFCLAVTRKQFLYCAIGLSSLFYLAADLRAYKSLRLRRAMVLAGFRYYRLDPAVNSPQNNPLVDQLFPEEKPFELQVLQESAREQLYSVPSAEDLRRY